MQTKIQNSRKNFIERRRAGIGGSDIAAIVGLSPWSTAYDIYRSKVDPDTEREAAISASMAVRLGVELEDFAARLFTEATGKRVQRCNHQFAAATAPFFIANLDRVVCDGNRAPVWRGELRTSEIVECKTSAVASEWGEPWSDEIPEHYRCQVQWQMGVTGAAVVWVPVVFLTVPYRFAVYQVKRDDASIAYLFAEGMKFWRNSVEQQNPPPVQTYADASRRWRGEPKKVATADADVIALLDRYRVLVGNLAEDEQKLDWMKAQICEAMGDATELRTEDGRKLATWSASKESAKVDYRGIVEELNPATEIIEKYTTKTATARRFMLAAQK